ncbi:cyclin-like protein [Mycena olivaceomarginata]|nr:cyclin-like protein [Mycena olivaceomarginata]
MICEVFKSKFSPATSRRAQPIRRAEDKAGSPSSAIEKRRKEPLRELTNGATSSQGVEQKLLKKPTTETRRPLSNAMDSDENARPPGKKEVHADTDESTSKRQRIPYLGPEGWTEVARERDAHSDGDGDGPTMASEDTQRYLRDVELNTMPNPNYMDDQLKLTWEMRGVLNDWLIQVHARFRLNPETLFLCTNLIDRFLSTRAVRPSKLQLVGVVCLLVAAKFEEIISPSIATLIFVCDHAYTCKDILQAEQHVLSALNWDLSYPSPVNYLHCISKADGCDPRIRTLARYLAEIACVEHRLLSAPPSLVAAAAMWLARLALVEEEAWTAVLAHCTTYAEDALVPVATHMLQYVLHPIRHENFYKKYAGKRNMKASVYMRHWALTHWTEGVAVNLPADLLDRASIRLALRACGG